MIWRCRPQFYTICTFSSPTSKLSISIPKSFLVCSFSAVSASKIFAIDVALSCFGLELTFKTIRDVSGLNIATKSQKSIFSMHNLTQILSISSKSSFLNHIFSILVGAGACRDCYYSGHRRKTYFCPSVFFR